MIGRASSTSAGIGSFSPSKALSGPNVFITRLPNLWALALSLARKLMFGSARGTPYFEDHSSAFNVGLLFGTLGLALCKDLPPFVT
jgi:hypothetical protein